MWILYWVGISGVSFSLTYLVLLNFQNLYQRIHEQNRHSKSCPQKSGHTGRDWNRKLHNSASVASSCIRNNWYQLFHILPTVDFLFFFFLTERAENKYIFPHPFFFLLQIRIKNINIIHQVAWLRSCESERIVHRASQRLISVSWAWVHNSQYKAVLSMQIHLLYRDLFFMACHFSGKSKTAIYMKVLQNIHFWSK